MAEADGSQKGVPSTGNVEAAKEAAKEASFMAKIKETGFQFKGLFIEFGFVFLIIVPEGNIDWKCCALSGGVQWSPVMLHHLRPSL